MAQHHLEQRFPAFLAPGTGFVEERFSMDRVEGVGGLGVILLRVTQLKSFTWAGHIRVRDPMRI